MAQNTRQWADLVRLTEARAGASFAAGTELSNIGYLLNSAAHIMYNESPWWERFLVVEERQVVNGYIPYEQDAYVVSGAGTSEVNGLYVRNGSNGEKSAYTLHESDGTTALYNLWFDDTALPHGKWYITSSDIGDLSVTLFVFYEGIPGFFGDNDIEDVDWSAIQGEEPAPLVQATSEIGEYIGHWDGDRWTCGGSNRGFAYPDHNGIRVTDCNLGSSVWVAYKKEFTDVYGDGQNGTISDVPAEWFEFMAYHAARSYQESQGEQIQSIALSTVQMVKDQALMKISRQGIYDTIAKRFRTLYGTDYSVR